MTNKQAAFLLQRCPGAKAAQRKLTMRVNRLNQCYSMRCILVVFMSLFSIATYAQVTLYGVVRDSVTGETVPYANIRIKGTIRGTATDEKGSFTLKTDSVPVVLIVTFIGYNTREVRVEKAFTTLNITLAPSARLLKEVVISSDPVKCLQEDQSLMATDFEFYDNYILLLAHKDVRSPSRLILLDESGNTISTLYVDKKNAESLYRDCFGNVHLQSKDSAWQVYYDYEKLQLLYPTTMADMKQNLYPCELFFRGRVFMSFHTFHRQRCLYYVGRDGVTTQFYYACDTTGTSRITANYDIRYFLNKRRKGEGYYYSVRFMKEHIVELQSGVPLSVADSLSLSPLNAPIVQHDNSVWIFQFSTDYAYRFNDQLAVQDSVPIKFRRQDNRSPGQGIGKDWTGELLRDEITDKLYTTYESKGIILLVSLTDDRFANEREVVLDDKPFARELKVRNGMLYFLWIDRTDASGNRMLYRMYI